MNIWIIARKELMVSLRDTRTFVFMLAFPIVLMLILGTALSNAFNSTTSIGDLKLLYNNETSNPQLAAYWDAFAGAVGQQGVSVTKLESGEDGKEEVRDNRYSAYAELNDDGIVFYGSSKSTIESNILEGMLTVFADRYALAAAAAKSDPGQVEAIVGQAGQGGEFIRETTLDPNKQPGSIDYYAIAMTTMIALYSAMSASYLFHGERIRKTAIRLAASPVGKGEIFVGKVIGCTTINYLCVLAVYLFSRFVFQADWGSHAGVVLLVLLAEVMFAVSLGLGISMLFKGEGARAVVMIFTQVASFVGGAYFPIVDSDGSVIPLTNLSPLRWANEALMKVIYANEVWAALPVIGLYAGIAGLFLVLAMTSIRRREAL